MPRIIELAKRVRLRKPVLIIVGVVALGFFLWFVNTFIYQNRAALPIATVTLTASKSTILFDAENKEEFSVAMSISGQKVSAGEFYVTYDANVIEYAKEYNTTVSGFSEVHASGDADYFEEPLIEGITDSDTGRKILKLVLVSTYTNTADPNWKTNVIGNLRFRVKGVGATTIKLSQDTGNKTQLAGIGQSGEATYFDLQSAEIGTTVTVTDTTTTITPGSTVTPDPISITPGASTTPGPITVTPGSTLPPPPRPQQEVAIQVVDKNGTQINVKSISRLRCPIGSSGCGSEDVSGCTIDNAKVNTSVARFPFASTEQNNCKAGALITMTEDSGGSVDGTPTRPSTHRATNGAGGDYYTYVSWPQWNSGQYTATVRMLDIQATPTVTPPNTITTIPPIISTTPSPSPTDSSGPTGNVTLDLKFKLQGIVDKPRDNTQKIIATAMVISNDRKVRVVKTFDAAAAGSSVWTGKADFEGVDLSKEYAVYIKGPKHLQNKFCENNPRENVPGGYHCSMGKFRFTPGTNAVDLSNVFVLAGDIPEQNGIVNAIDLVFIRQNFGQKDETMRARGDLNYDGIIDTQDYSLVLAALAFKFDEE